MRNKLILLLSLVLLLSLSVSCGSSEDSEIAAYREAMSTFFDSLSDQMSDLDVIEASSPSAREELLAAIDGMKQLCDDAVSIPVPEQFVNAGEMTKETAKYMDLAAEQYHLALDDPSSFDEAAFDYAGQYYNIVGIRLRYLVSFLHGETPEGLDIHYEEASDEAVAIPEEASDEAADAPEEDGAAEE